MLSEIKGIPSTAGVPQISGRNNFHHHNIWAFGSSSVPVSLGRAINDTDEKVVPKSIATMKRLSLVNPPGGALASDISISADDPRTVKTLSAAYASRTISSLGFRSIASLITYGKQLAETIPQIRQTYT
jgi:hypothetical protein